MNLFDTDVQELKYHVLCEVAKLAYANDLTPQKLIDIAARIVPAGGPKMRCCIYKERAIVGERVKLALGGDRSNPNVVEVLQIACDECPVDGIQIMPSCRGCIAHRCMNVCPKGAISIVDCKATIDKSKCVECGRCLSACSYSAIVKNTRPCVNACRANALTIDFQNQKAAINQQKCISCGACVYQCPFGAISDKSYIVDAINIISKSEKNTAYKVYAIVAPSLASQYANIPGITIEKVITAIKRLGFHSVVEAALGADIVAYKEASEFAQRGFMTSSCCPAFVKYIQTNHPKLTEFISHNVSPMTQLAMVIKEMDPGCKTVFIGPCIAKKGERMQEDVREFVDCILTFEELQAMFCARDLDLQQLEETPINNASYFGRIFARSGGLAEALQQALHEQNISQEQCECRPLSCNGISECKTALLKAAKGVLKENFIEGMACELGCIGGPACLSHSSRDKFLVDSFGQSAVEKTISGAVSILDITNLHITNRDDGFTGKSSL